MRLIRADLYERLVFLRRLLHQYPELSWQETQTAAVITKFLQEIGIQCRTNVLGGCRGSEPAQKKTEKAVDEITDKAVDLMRDVFGGK